MYYLHFFVCTSFCWYSLLYICLSVNPCCLFCLTRFLCCLDGAKKPWDRANSADRSMVSRWDLEAPQRVGYVCEAEQQTLIECFILLCRVRPVGSGSDTDSLDLDRMKQVKERHCNDCTLTQSQNVKFMLICFLIFCFTTLLSKNSLFSKS